MNNENITDGRAHEVLYFCPVILYKPSYCFIFFSLSLSFFVSVETTSCFFSRLYEEQKKRKKKKKQDE